MTTKHTYQSQSARDAQAMGYGGPSYWDYLERTAHEYRELYLKRGDQQQADAMLTRSISEALHGNDGL